MATVDVIIPTRNRFAFTLAAIGSVVAQTFRDWHLYVVDDASDDGSVDRIRERVAGDQRITVVERATTGRAAHARQTGFERGRAEWIATLDSDDLWHPEKLERQLAVSEGRDVVLCWHTWLRPDGTPRVTRMPRGEGRVSPLLTSNVDTLLARRSLVEEIGGFAPTDGPELADENIDFFIRLLGAADVAVVERVLAWCRDHRTGRTSDAMSAASLAQIIDTRRSLLEPYPEDFGPFLCRLGARLAAEGDVRTSWARTAEGLRMCSWIGRARAAREFGPHLLRSTTRALMRGRPRR